MKTRFSQLRDWCSDLLYHLGIGHYSYSQDLTRRLLLEYFLSLSATLLGLGVLEVFCAFFFASYRGWRNVPILADFIRFCSNAPLITYLLSCVVGWIFCTILFLRRPLKYLDELIYAAEDLTRDTSRPILLPEALRQAQDYLNNAREKALWAAARAKEAEQRKNALDKALRLEDLVNEFFDITRFNLTTLILESERTNLSRMLEQVTSEFLPVLAGKSLSWETVIPPDVELVCDRDKLQRVLDNLIRNAVNYSYPDTAISLTMDPGVEDVTLRIQNHGRTIPPEKLCHIFEQFYRVDSSRASATGGAGLGLAIAKEIIELHGGTITAESENESILFTVILPRERG